MEYASVNELKSYLAFFVSKFNEDAMTSLWYTTQSNMIDDFNVILDEDNPKNSYISFRINEFDIFFDNWRKWRKWRPALKSVFQMYKMRDQISFDEMFTNVWIILNTRNVPITLIYSTVKEWRIIDLREEDFDIDYEIHLSNWEWNYYNNSSESKEKRQWIRHEFWETLMAEFNKKSDLFSWRKNYWNDTRLSAKSWIPEIRFSFVVSSTYTSVEYTLSKTDDKAYNKKVFDYLYKNKEDIEKKFWDKLFWERLDDKIMSRISYRLEWTNVYDKSQWEKIEDFLIKNMIKLEGALRGYIDWYKN